MAGAGRETVNAPRTRECVHQRAGDKVIAPENIRVQIIEQYAVQYTDELQHDRIEMHILQCRRLTLFCRDIPRISTHGPLAPFVAVFLLAWPTLTIMIAKLWQGSTYISPHSIGSQVNEHSLR
jgi:hypothetical protein